MQNKIAKSLQNCKIPAPGLKVGAKDRIQSKNPGVYKQKRPALHRTF